ncbi:phosphoglycerate mutase family protein [Hyphomonas neptunium ATCC 15444]|uniref:Phosphoglycerate mutase family protein n=2 Tax=Hyphomonas TaxID=85 RepID=Q0C173_HYPNA|nr:MULTISPECIES: histidine phosphatase family protein [Hyphomonas]ABI77619.1 phosphoglycerate mutase family protein [Hyphomonas neptunium ATCC 15444]KCZ95067.1 phosphoglycerate mutase family protein [Hyphomonas hirschiana VP5]
MTALFFITHPEVIVDPAIPVGRWRLSPAGIARMQVFSASQTMANVRTIWASSETKAIEAAEILGRQIRAPVNIHAGLGENDRQSTGFLPPAEFEQVADAFFAQPEHSIRGWERALDAQSRILKAFKSITENPHAGDMAIVSHGAVGTLLFCALTGQPISRHFDQPFQGHYWRAPFPDLKPETGWEPIACR